MEVEQVLQIAISLVAGLMAALKAALHRMAGSSQYNHRDTSCPLAEEVVDCTHNSDERLCVELAVAVQEWVCLELAVAVPAAVELAVELSY